jgi:hypothetical protein
MQVFDEGIAQYSLTDAISHSKFYASLILGKPSLRCTVIDNEPNDILEAHNNTFTVVSILFKLMAIFIRLMSRKHHRASMPKTF